jgi:hypothetical protein
MSEHHEVWKSIPGYEGLYEVSDQGRVKSLLRKILRKTGHWHTVPERIMKHNKSGGRNRQYCSIGLSLSGEVKYWYVHHLVLLAFRGERPTNMEVNHIDGNHANNVLSNLEYVTKRENVQHAINELGTYKRPSSPDLRGEKSGTSKLTWDDVDEIRAHYARGGISQEQLAKEFGVCQAQIWRIIHNKRWASDYREKS